MYIRVFWRGVSTAKKNSGNSQCPFMIQWTELNILESFIWIDVQPADQAHF
jgi:hypothetical protein